MIKPDNNSKTDKKEQVSSMFDSISGKYDFLNHFFSIGLDHLWRKKAVKKLSQHKPSTILDIATGTGDFAIASLTLNPQKVYGIDLSEKMMQVGQKKIERKNLADKIFFMKADAENIPFDNNSFDAATVGFGVRNFSDPQKGLQEICRVLKPGGRLVILEFSKPQLFPFRQIYYFYFKRIMPIIGRFVSKDKNAYSYLPESVMAFPDREEFVNLLRKAGFSKSNYQSLSLGAVMLYYSEK